MRLKYKTWNWLPLYTFWYYRKTWTHKTRVRSKRRENPTKVLALSLSTREKHWNNFDDFHIIFIAFDLIKNEWILHITSNLILTSIYMCICIPEILCFVFIFIYSCHLHRLLQLDSIRIFEDEPLQWWLP